MKLLETKYYCVVDTSYSKESFDKLELKYIRQRTFFGITTEAVKEYNIHFFVTLAPFNAIDFLTDFISDNEKKYGKCLYIHIPKADAALISEIDKDPILSKYSRISMSVKED